GKRRESIIRGWRNYFCYPEIQDHNEDDEIAIPEKSSNPATEAALHEDSTAIGENRTPSIDPDASVAATVKSPSVQQSCPESRLSREDRENAVKETIEQINILVETERYSMAINRIRFLLNDEDSAVPANLVKDLYVQLASLYSKLGLRGAADSCRIAGGLKPEKMNSPAQELVFGTADVQCWMELFHSGQIAYMQFVDRLGRHGYRPAAHPLTPQFLHNHWKGEMTLSVPLFDKGNKVRFAVIDLDITRKTLDNARQDEFNKIKRQLLDDARGILDIAFKAGIVGIIEDSGYKGYHVWFFFNERVPGAFAASFLRSLDRRIGRPSEGTHRELFPASAELAPDQLNSRIKLHLGIHRLSGNRSKFLTPEGVESLAPLQLLTSHSILNGAGKIKSAIAYWDKYRNDSSSSSVDKPAPTDELSILFSKCSVLNAIRVKAQEKGGLNHYDRIVLRGILSPLGCKGREEIHRILKYCENYSHALTDKMIGSDQYKPIGCHRIREILGDFCANVNCSCTFKTRKGVYATPLRHLELQESRVIKEPPPKTEVPAQVAASTSSALNTGTCQPTTVTTESHLASDCKNNNASNEIPTVKNPFLNFSLNLGKLQISVKL
ncbi:MAG: CRISPR-associated primase-polymerase type A1, partial [Lentisphaerae bacterium]|nr:CRISPR-associated primase-polymerase type A1 [Lentisphaerota bacterium]